MFQEHIIKKRKVAAYARVSTAAEEQETSLLAQRDYYEKYIRENKEWEFVGIYYDDGISGLSFNNREGFNTMVQDALDGKIDLILTKSLSRFARNTVDTLTTIRKLKAANIEVYFEKENIFTLDSKGEFLITLMSSIAQEESRSISENVTWGQRKRFADGKYHMPYAQFLGYDRGADGTPVVNQEEAVTVRLIYLLYLMGYAEASVGKILQEFNIPSPGGKEKWTSGTIRSILGNEKYKGDALLQKCFTTDFLTKKTKKNEGELPQYYVTEGHEAIVSKKVFELADIEHQRRSLSPKRYCGIHPLSSVCVCGGCGAFLGLKTAHSNDKYRSLFWRCNRFYDEGKHAPTIKHDIICYCLQDIQNQIFEDYGFVINRTFSLVAAVAPQLRKKKFLQIIDKENLFLENRMFSRTVLDHILVSEDGILEFVLKNGYRVTVDSKNIILDDIEESAEEIDIEDVYMDIPEEEVSILTSIPKISKKATPRSERLTEDEKKTIIDLRLAGNTFSSIAETLVRNINTVKVFYFRNQYNPKYVENVKTKVGCCLQCGKPITEISKHRPRKFCSHSCKDLWWRAHKKPIYTFSCAHCGKTFGTASKTQKYCSTDCFHASRKKG